MTVFRKFEVCASYEISVVKSPPSPSRKTLAATAKNDTHTVMTDIIWTKYKTTLYGLLGGLTFALLCAFLFLMDKGELILLLLYIPGSIFGLAITISLKKYTDSYGVLFLLSTIEYLAMIFFCSKNYDYLAIRRIVMGGVGAILFLTTVSLFTTIKLSLDSYLLGFVIGIATTFFMWTDNFESFNPWLATLSIVLWQTFIAAIINRRQLTWDKKVLIK